MAILNLKRLVVKDIKDNDVELNIAEGIGNQMYMSGQNIEECELGKRIYFADKNEGIEINDNEIKLLSKYAENYSYIVRSAIARQLES